MEDSQVSCNVPVTINFGQTCKDYNFPLFSILFIKSCGLS